MIGKRLRVKFRFDVFYFYFILQESHGPINYDDVTQQTVSGLFEPVCDFVTHTQGWRACYQFGLLYSEGWGQ